MKTSVVFLMILILFMPGCRNVDNNRIKAPGTINGDIVAMKAQVAGSLSQLLIREGEAVEKGAPIAHIDRSKIENQLEQLDIQEKGIALRGEKLEQKKISVQENLKYFTRQVERFERLKQGNAISGENLENMKLKKLDAETAAFDIRKSLESLQVELEKIAKQRAYLRLLGQDHELRSPVKGIVIETFVREGENVFPGTAIADILDLSSLYAETFIEEREIGRIALGQKVEIHLDGLNKQPLDGQISYFGRKAEFSPKYVISEKERQSLLYQVKIKVNGDNPAVKIGQPVTVWFTPGKTGNSPEKN